MPYPMHHMPMHNLAGMYAPPPWALQQGMAAMGQLMELQYQHLQLQRHQMAQMEQRARATQQLFLQGSGGQPQLEVCAVAQPPSPSRRQPRTTPASPPPAPLPRPPGDHTHHTTRFPRHTGVEGGGVKEGRHSRCCWTEGKGRSHANPALSFALPLRPCSLGRGALAVRRTGACAVGGHPGTTPAPPPCKPPHLFSQFLCELVALCTW